MKKSSHKFRKISAIDRSFLSVRWIPENRITREFDISKDTLEAWHRQGLPKYQLGRIILYKNDELNELIEKHKKLPINNKTRINGK
jgi:hypothetical protein